MLRRLMVCEHLGLLLRLLLLLPLLSRVKEAISEDTYSFTQTAVRASYYIIK